ncbi:hypothetical protein CkaCkLH20_08685 [Colletotrichum karsti]|uniref:WSC domain-containing protein n=1 Tax=Colletotrichum karsti TaxID=1095194 RepID=A0A9P6I4Q0_9PEZI|nr:uncharacterized protein CkaCkLH20_08685 [Colletotrichum karsti]KAF9873951.1 hypothetical protein CkaCkLH20_08685 [Colletotrichum karsti]
MGGAYWSQPPMTYLNCGAITNTTNLELVYRGSNSGPVSCQRRCNALPRKYAVIYDNACWCSLPGTDVALANTPPQGGMSCNQITCQEQTQGGQLPYAEFCGGTTSVVQGNQTTTYTMYSVYSSTTPSYLDDDDNWAVCNEFEQFVVELCWNVDIVDFYFGFFHNIFVGSQNHDYVTNVKFKSYYYFHRDKHHNTECFNLGHVDIHLNLQRTRFIYFDINECEPEHIHFISQFRPGHVDIHVNFGDHRLGNIRLVYLGTRERWFKHTHVPGNLDFNIPELHHTRNALLLLLLLRLASKHRLPDQPSTIHKTLTAHDPLLPKHILHNTLTHPLQPNHQHHHCEPLLLASLLPASHLPHPHDLQRAHHHLTKRTINHPLIKQQLPHFLARNLRLRIAIPKHARNEPGPRHIDVVHGHGRDEESQRSVRKCEFPPRRVHPGGEPRVEWPDFDLRLLDQTTLLFRRCKCTIIHDRSS